jgi:hypothetical protein
MMTPTEKKMVLDRLDKFEEVQKKHEERIAHTLELSQATASVVAEMEGRMATFEPILAGIDGKLTELLEEKRMKQVADDAIRSTPFAKFMADLKKKLREALVLMISGFMVAVVVGLFFLLLKSGAFKALGWG